MGCGKAEKIKKKEQRRSSACSEWWVINGKQDWCSKFPIRSQHSRDLDWCLMLNHSNSFQSINSIQVARLTSNATNRQWGLQIIPTCFVQWIIVSDVQMNVKREGWNSTSWAHICAQLVGLEVVLKNIWKQWTSSLTRTNTDFYLSKMNPPCSTGATFE